MNDVRILIVARDPLARAGLATLPADQPGCAVVGQVGVDSSLSDNVSAFQPDALVWDLGWDTDAALEDMADLAEAGPPILALLPDGAHVAGVRDSGALGVLPREADAESMVAAAAAVSKGMIVLHPDLHAPPAADGISPSTAALDSPLTAREQAVLRLLAEGLPNKTIAHRLDISEHTVKFHVASIMSKLGAQSRTEAVILASRLGLIPL